MTFKVKSYSFHNKRALLSGFHINLSFGLILSKINPNLTVASKLFSE